MQTKITFHPFMSGNPSKTYATLIKNNGIFSLNLTFLLKNLEIKITNFNKNMNIEFNKISNAWQKLKDPCDYVSFIAKSFAYIISLGNLDIFPRVRQQGLNNDKITNTLIQNRTISHEDNSIGNCISALDKNNYKSAAELLSKIFSNLPQPQKNEIRRAFGIRTQQLFTQTSDQQAIISVLKAIDNKLDSIPFSETTLQLLSDSQLMIIRATLAKYQSA